MAIKSKIVSVDPVNFPTRFIKNRPAGYWDNYIVPDVDYQGARSSDSGPTGADNPRPSYIPPPMGVPVLERRAGVPPSLGLPTLSKKKPPPRGPVNLGATLGGWLTPTTGSAVRPTVVPSQGNPPPPPTPTKKIWGPHLKGETEMPIDLGNLLGKAIDVYGSIERADARGPTVAQPVGFNYGPSLSSPTWPGALTPTLGIPGAELISEAPLDKGLVYKKVCGEYRWVKQSRRRRKKLLTDADFNALLRIQALKVNTNMTIAIAKALGR